jgi:hypothetical protein
VPITGSKKKKKVKVRKADKMERDLESPMMFLKQKDKNKDMEFDKEDAPKDSYFPEMPIDSRMTNSSPTLSNQKLLHTESVD